MRILTALGIAFVAGLGISAKAQANTYCAELPGDASCTQNFTGTGTSIQAAVDAADDHSGPDTVKVGPGNFVMPSPVYLSNFGEGNRLTLVGSGDGTVLSGSDPTDPDIHFAGGTGSSISNLTISIPDDASNQSKIGLALDDGATGEDLFVTFATGLTSGDPSIGYRTTGVRLEDGATLSNSTVRLFSTNVNDAVTTFGNSNTVRHSSLHAFRDVYQSGTSGITEVRRSALIVISAGAVNIGGTMNIRDSVIVAPFGGSSQGVYLSSDSAASNTLIEGTTMVGAPGSGGGASVGIVAVSAEGPPNPGNTQLRLDSSVVSGFDYAIAHQTFFAQDTLGIDVDSSAYDATRVSSSPGAGTPNIDLKGLVDLDGVDPRFLDPGNGDFSLASGSPLIDVGQEASPPLGSTDWQGDPRACDGNDDGAIRRDIGAFERRTDPNDDCVAPETTITAGPSATTTFPYSFTVGSNEGSSTWRCAFDGGAKSACGPQVNAPDLGLGARAFSVQAVDQYGNMDQTPAVSQYTVVDGGDGGDTTAPKITKLKGPKSTKKKRAKVTFSADEAGVEFTCQLNKSKPADCKSPWKTPKLKKGKNTIQVWATDRAGNRSDVVKLGIKLK